MLIVRVCMCRHFCTSYGHRKYRKKDFTMGSVKAAVIPSCGGKSTIAASQGYFDIDSLIPFFGSEWPNIEARITRALSNPSEWPVANKFLWEAQRRALKVIPLSGRKLVLLHSREQARALGFEPILTLLPDESLHSHAIDRRGPSAKEAATQNKKSAILEAKEEHAPVLVYQSFDELRILLRSYANSV